MACTCNKKINCNNGEECPCGIELKLYDSSDNLVETLDGYGYSLGGENYFQFEQGTTFPTGTLVMSYNDTIGRWELVHNDPTLYLPATSMLFGTYTTDALCPDSDCGLDLSCNTLEFQFGGISFGNIQWQGDLYNGRKLYRIDINDYPLSGLSGENFIIYWGNNQNMQQANGITENRWLLVSLGVYTMENLPFPLEDVSTSGEVTMSLTGYIPSATIECSDGDFQPPTTGGFPPRVGTVPEGPQGYTGVVEKVECGCCDEEISVSVLLSNVEYDFTADVATDSNGNVLGINGYQYYSFVYDTGGPTTPTYYIFFDGNNWVVNDSLGGKGGIHVNQSEIQDCPYGFYTRNTSDDAIIQIKGVECFDCCDYYTPRFTNFIRKQRAILVDDTSYIRKKEVFGMKCGGEWEDIFRKHLIIDTLSCLPYGVLCEEEEECLIENLYKNCNC